MIQFTYLHVIRYLSNPAKPLGLEFESQYKSDKDYLEGMKRSPFIASIDKDWLIGFNDVLTHQVYFLRQKPKRHIRLRT